MISDEELLRIDQERDFLFRLLRDLRDHVSELENRVIRLNKILDANEERLERLNQKEEIQDERN